MHLSEKDRKILSILDLNARSSYESIARACKISKETVIYRIKKLEAEHVIGRYATLVNFAKLGYTGFAVYCRLVHTNASLRDNFISFLSRMPQLYWVALIGGRFDIVFAVMCRSVFEFNSLYYSILNKYGEYLTDITVQIRTELQQNGRKYLLSEPDVRPTSPYFGKQPELEPLDELDADILTVLSNHARMPVLHLSKLLRKPPSTIALRIKTLMKRGIIQGFSTYIRAGCYGMQSYRLLLHLTHLDEKIRRKLFGYVSLNKHMILAIETVGVWNFEITLEVESHAHLQKEITALRDTFNENIRNLEFVVMFEDDLVYDPYPLEKEKRLSYNLPSL